MFISWIIISLPILHYAQTIETAIRAGLNYVDTSPFYGEGKSEEVLGRIVDNDIEDLDDLDCAR